MTQEQFEILFNKAKEIMLTSKDPVHNWQHIERVLNNAKNILARLPLAKRQLVDEKLLFICCVWHDISHAVYQVGFAQKFLEGRRSAKIIYDFFGQEKISQAETFVVADNAIRHAMKELRFFGRNNLSLYHKILQDADWLDNFYSPRVQQLSDQVEKSFYAFVVIKILKPIFYNWQRKNMGWFLNLSESLDYFKSPQS